MADLQRTVNAKRNIIWALITKVLMIAGPFVIRTIFIQKLGAEYLGLSGVYTSILQVLNLTELGFGTAVSYSMYKPVAEGDVRQVAAYLNYFKGVYRKVGLAILGMGLVILPFLQYFINDPCPPDVNLYLGFALYLGNSVLSYFLFAYKQSLLAAYQRNDAISKVAMVVVSLQYVLQIAVLLLVPNFYLYVLVIPLCTMLANLLTAAATNRLLPEYSEASLKAVRPTDEERAGVRQRVKGLMLQQLVGVSRNSLDNLFISAFIGLIAVAAFGNYFVVMSGLVGVLTTIIGAITSVVGNSVATESKEKNFADCRLFCFIYAMVAIVCSACLISLYQPFIVIWVGEELLLGIEVPLLLTIYFYVLSMGDIRSVYLNASGIWWELRWMRVAEAVANVVLNLIFVQLLGIAGVVLGTVLSLFFINFVGNSCLVFKHYFGTDKLKPFFADHALYALVALAVCAATYGVCSFIPDGGLVLWLAKALVALVVSGVLLLVIFGRTKRFKEAWAFAKRVLHARAGK